MAWPRACCSVPAKGDTCDREAGGHSAELQASEGPVLGPALPTPPPILAMGGLSQRTKGHGEVPFTPSGKGGAHPPLAQHGLLISPKSRTGRGER